MSETKPDYAELAELMGQQVLRAGSGKWADLNEMQSMDICHALTTAAEDAKKLAEAERQIRELRAENARLALDAPDAKRYRWLRNDNLKMDYTHDFPQGWLLKTKAERFYLAVMNKNDFPECIKMTVHLHHAPKGGEPIWINNAHFDFGANLDAAIDAAISTNTANTKG